MFGAMPFESFRKLRIWIKTCLPLSKKASKGWTVNDVTAEYSVIADVISEKKNKQILV